MDHVDIILAGRNTPETKAESLLRLLGLSLQFLLFVVFYQHRADESANKRHSGQQQRGRNANNPLAWREDLGSRARLVNERHYEGPCAIVGEDSSSDKEHSKAHELIKGHQDGDCALWGRELSVR